MPNSFSYKLINLLPSMVLTQIRLARREYKNVLPLLNSRSVDLTLAINSGLQCA